LTDARFPCPTGFGLHINSGDSMTYAAPLLIKADGSHDINIVTSP
jgi:hypothetical protein